MKEIKKETNDKNIVVTEEALSRSEQFIERNLKIIIGVITAIVLLIAVILIYTRFILGPQQQEAMAEMFMAERYFEQDSLRLALEGDGTHLGFLDIISEYRMTRSANLARYYAGISHLWLGEYEEAIRHLKRFRGGDQMITALAYGAIGDAYLQLEDNPKALKHYAKAYKHEPNQFTTPMFLMKAARVHELEQNYAEAIKLYEKIRTDYPASNEARNIERYIARAETLLGNTSGN